MIKGSALSPPTGRQARRGLQVTLPVRNCVEKADFPYKEAEKSLKAADWVRSVIKEKIPSLLE